MSKKLMTNIFVELHIPDFNLAVEFYSKLGFDIVWKNSSAEGYMVMRRGNSILNFYAGSEKVYDHSFFSRYPRGTVRGYGVEIAIPVENIENFYDSVTKTVGLDQGKGGIVEELEMKPWGKKDFRMIDPFGFYICITEGVNYLIP